MVGHQSERGGLKQKQGVVKNNLPEDHVAMELLFPPPLQPSSASLHKVLEDNLQNLGFYFYPTDHIFHTAHLFIRLKIRINL